MAYSRDTALDFWYAFDQAFLFNPSDEVRQLYSVVYGPDGYALDPMVDRVRDHRQPEELAATLSGREAGLKRLAELQLEIMDKYLPSLPELQLAFEEFGQGVLYDAKPSPAEPGERRRPRERLIHMMDGSPDACVGYHRWHAFIRAAVAVGADKVRWLNVNRLVGLAWAIYSELDPAIDAPDNPPISEERLDALRDIWLSADAQEMNDLFLAYEGEFPRDYGSRRARDSRSTAWLDVQRILVNAAKNSNPGHGGVGRFWELPMEEFVRVQVYGLPIIAPPGPNRGARSALVKVLRGELSGYPRMPMNRPAVPDLDIERIARWIDSLP